MLVSVPTAVVVIVNDDFTTGLGSVDLDYSGMANGPVYATAQQPDGKVIVVGDFSGIGGAARLLKLAQKGLAHAKHLGTGSAAREFSIRESACSPFAEKIVAFGVKRAPRVERLHVPYSFVDRRTAFEEKRPIAAFGEKIGCGETSRPGSNYDRAMQERSDARNGH